MRLHFEWRWARPYGCFSCFLRSRRQRPRCFEAAGNHISDDGVSQWRRDRQRHYVYGWKLPWICHASLAKL